MRWQTILISFSFACGSSTTTTTDGGVDAPPTGDSSTTPQWVQTALFAADIIPALAIDSKDSNTVYVGVSAGSTQKGFFRTKDGGKTWTKLAGGLPDQYAGALALSSSGTLLMNPGVQGIWRSTNGGDSFVQAATDPGGPSSLIFHPNGTMAWGVTSQQGCIRSSDSGSSWATTTNTNLPLNQFGLGPLTFDGTKLYLATDSSAVYVSTDNGDSWTKTTSTGLPTGSGSSPTNIIATPARPGVLFVTTTSQGIYRSGDAGATFTRQNPGGTDVRYWGLRFDPSNTMTVYTSMNETQGGPGGIFKTSNDGQAWAAFGPPTIPVNTIDVATTDGTVYIGTIGKGVWRYGK